MMRKESKMARVSVTKLFEFEAAHHLPNYDGACKNLHGHTYKLEVEVTRKDEYEFDEPEAMVMDFKKLKEIVNANIIDKFDHSNLNDFFDNPTAERMVVWIYELLKMSFVKERVMRVRLWETSSSYAEVKAS